MSPKIEPDRHTLPLIEIVGGPRERGRQQGERARSQVLRALERYREIIPKALDLPWANALRGARKFLPYGEESRLLHRY